MNSCSFTGHRKIEYSRIAPLEELLGRAVDYAYSQGCRSFYCGGAIGFDTMAAKAVLEKRIFHRDIRLIIVMPCEEQTLGWSDRNKDIYDYILSEADECICISKEYTKSCMRERNLYLAERCDMLVAYVGRNNSGSSQTLRFAESLGKTVYNLYKKLN